MSPHDLEPHEVCWLNAEEERFLPAEARVHILLAQDALVQEHDKAEMGRQVESLEELVRLLALFAIMEAVSAGDKRYGGMTPAQAEDLERLLVQGAKLALYAMMEDIVRLNQTSNDLYEELSSPELQHAACEGFRGLTLQRLLHPMSRCRRMVQTRLPQVLASVASLGGKELSDHLRDVLSRSGVAASEERRRRRRQHGSSSAGANDAASATPTLTPSPLSSSGTPQLLPWRTGGGGNGDGSGSGGGAASSGRLRFSAILDSIDGLASAMLHESEAWTEPAAPPLSPMRWGWRAAMSLSPSPSTASPRSAARTAVGFGAASSPARRSFWDDRGDGDGDCSGGGGRSSSGGTPSPHSTATSGTCSSRAAGCSPNRSGGAADGRPVALRRSRRSGSCCSLGGNNDAVGRGGGEIRRLPRSSVGDEEPPQSLHRPEEKWGYIVDGGGGNSGASSGGAISAKEQMSPIDAETDNLLREVDWLMADTLARLSEVRASPACITVLAAQSIAAATPRATAATSRAAAAAASASRAAGTAVQLTLPRKQALRTASAAAEAQGGALPDFFADSPPSLRQAKN